MWTDANVGGSGYSPSEHSHKKAEITRYCQSTMPVVQFRSNVYLLKRICHPNQFYCCAVDLTWTKMTIRNPGSSGYIDQLHFTPWCWLSCNLQWHKSVLQVRVNIFCHYPFLTTAWPWLNGNLQCHKVGSQGQVLSAFVTYLVQQGSMYSNCKLIEMS